MLHGSRNFFRNFGNYLSNFTKLRCYFQEYETISEESDFSIVKVDADGKPTLFVRRLRLFFRDHENYEVLEYEAV
jgi:hypothetical protein